MTKANIYYLSDYRKSGNPLSMELIAKLERQLVEAGLMENSGNLKRKHEFETDYHGFAWNGCAVEDKTE